MACASETAGEHRASEVRDTWVVVSRQRLHDFDTEQAQQQSIPLVQAVLRAFAAPVRCRSESGRDEWFALTRSGAHALIGGGSVSVGGSVVMRDPAFRVDLLPPDTKEEDDGHDGGDHGDRGDAMAAIIMAVRSDALRHARSLVRVWAVWKPEGVNCCLVPHDPSSLLHLLKSAGLDTTAGDDDAAHPVGRLDKDSCGLLLLTTHGVVSERLMHPAFHHEKVYEVIVNRPAPLPDSFLQRLRSGVTWKATGGAVATSNPCRVDTISNPLLSLSQRFLPQTQEAEGDKSAVARPMNRKELKARGRVLGGAALRFHLTQGLNRQIRHMVQAAGDAADAEARPQYIDDDDGSADRASADGPLSMASGESSTARSRDRYCVLRLERTAIGPVSSADAFGVGDVLEGARVQPASLRSFRCVDIEGLSLTRLLWWAFYGRHREAS